MHEAYGNGSTPKEHFSLLPHAPDAAEPGFAPIEDLAPPNVGTAGDQRFAPVPSGEAPVYTGTEPEAVPHINSFAGAAERQRVLERPFRVARYILGATILGVAVEKKFGGSNTEAVATGIGGAVTAAGAVAFGVRNVIRRARQQRDR